MQGPNIVEVGTNPSTKAHATPGSFDELLDGASAPRQVAPVFQLGQKLHDAQQVIPALPSRFATLRTRVEDLLQVALTVLLGQAAADDLLRSQPVCFRLGRGRQRRFGF